MKKLTLILTLSVLALVSALLLCACDSADTPSDTTAETTDTTPTETADMAGDTTTVIEETTAEAPTKVTYTVTVKDQDGNPVADVEVQMCDDSGCKLPSPTDANGVVTFSYTASNYHITLVSIPDGYSYADGDATTQYDFPDGSTELTVTVTKD